MEGWGKGKRKEEVQFDKEKANEKKEERKVQ